MFTASIVELSAALRAKRLSCVELTRGLLDQITRLNPILNAFITVDPERALADAKAADAAIAAGAAGIDPAALAALSESAARTAAGGAAELP